MAGVNVKGLDEHQARLKKLQDAVNASLMAKVGQAGVNIIQDRTERGEFLNPGAKKTYSKAAALFSMKGSAQLKKYYRSKLKGGRRKGGMKKGDSTARFVFLENGYMQYREIHGKQAAFVNLMFSGGMMDGMFHSATDDAAILGFRDERDRKLAYYHSIAGAGKSKVIREFFGFSEPEKDMLFEIFENEVDDFLATLN